MKNKPYWLVTAVFAVVMICAGSGAVYYQSKAVLVEQTGAAFSAALERSMDAISAQWSLEDNYDKEMPGYKTSSEELKRASQEIKSVEASLTDCEEEVVTEIRRDIGWGRPEACQPTANSPLIAAYREAAMKERKIYIQLNDIRNAHKAARAKALDIHAETDKARHAFVAAVGNGPEPLIRSETKTLVKSLEKKFHNLTGVTAIFALLLLVMIRGIANGKTEKEKTV
jgi:hypothetical protein